MKRIEIVMPPARFEEIKDALADAGVLGITAREAKVFDRASRRREVYRGSSYTVDFTLKVEVVILVRACEVAGLLKLLEELFAIGPAHEGTVCISDVVEAIAIRPTALADDRST